MIGEIKTGQDDDIFIQREMYTGQNCSDGSSVGVWGGGDGKGERSFNSISLDNESSDNMNAQKQHTY